MCCFSYHLALYLDNYLQYSIDIINFKYMKLADAIIWNSIHASFCQVFANWVTL